MFGITFKSLWSINGQKNRGVREEALVIVQGRTIT